MKNGYKRASTATKMKNPRRSGRGLIVLEMVLCLAIMIGCTAGCKTKTPTTTESEDSQTASSVSAASSESASETGFYDADGKYYTYFDEDNDSVWDGFTDESGAKFYFFDENGDDTWDGYSDQDGNRSYYGKTAVSAVASESSTGGNTSASTAETASTQSTKVTKTSQELYSEIKGTTVKILYNSTPASVEQKKIAAFERAYSCTVQPVVMTWNDWQNQILSMVVSGNVPDTCSLSDVVFLKWLARGLVQPIDSYVNPDDEIWDDYTWGAYSWKGKHYGVSDSHGAGLYVVYNATLFEAKGVKTPLEYYQEGDWNFTNFRKAAIAMTYEGVIGSGTDWKYIFALSNGNSIVNVDNDAGTVSLALNQSNAVTGLDLVTELARGSYFQWGNCFDDFANGKIAMFLERPWNVIGSLDLRNTTMVNSEIEICPLPKGPDTDSNLLVTILSPGGVPTGASNPLGACAWYYFNAQYSEKHQDDEDVVADRRLTYTDEQYQFVKEYEATATRINTFAYGIDTWYSDDWPYWSDMFYNGYSAQAAYEKYEGEFLNMISTLDTIS